jgi:hypothetical protein
MPLPSDPADPPRGFVYFCESRLRYHGGLGAWYFFGPFLLGAVVFDSILLRFSGLPSLVGWIALVAYVVVFPPLWRLLLMRLGWWRRRPE